MLKSWLENCIAWVVLISLGAILAMALLPSNKVRSTGGRPILLKENPTWKPEFVEMWRLLKAERWIIFLFPFLWSSNWFAAYESNDVNLAKFDIRTRALNNLLMNSCEVLGALVMGFFLDSRIVSRKNTARIGWVVIMVLTLTIWGGGLAFQLPYTRETVSAKGFIKSDWTDGHYIGPMFLYMAYGAFDAMWQTYSYWLMGSLTNSTRKLAIYAGFYKSIQSAGAAVMWKMDEAKLPFMNIFISVWVLLAGSLVIAAPVVYYKVVEKTDEETDLIFTEE